MDYVRPLFRSISDSSNDHDIIEHKLDIISTEGSDIRARKREGEPLDDFSESPKRKKVSNGFMEYALQPFRTVFKMFSGSHISETDEGDSVAKSLASPGDKKFNFPHVPDEGEEDLNENYTECESEKNEVVFRVDESERTDISVTLEKPATPTALPDTTITVSDDSSENEVEIVAEIHNSPKTNVSKASGSVTQLQEIIALSHPSSTLFSPTQSDSISNYSTNGLRSFSGSPCPDDSVSRQTTPKSFFIEPSTCDRWSRKSRRIHHRKLVDGCEKYIRDYIQNYDKDEDPMITNSIQISARDTYKAMLAARDNQKTYTISKTKKIGKLKSSGIHNKYLRRVKNALVKLPAHINLSDNEGRKKTASVASEDNRALGAGESVTNIEVASEPSENTIHNETDQTSGRSSPTSVASSTFSNRLEDSVNDIMERIREVDLKLSEQHNEYDRYQNEIESRRRREIELKETLRIATLSRTADRAEIEERVRQNLELVGIRPPKPKPPTKNEFPELTLDMVELCRTVWSKSDPNELFVNTPTTKISRKDLCTLSGLNWLNDEIINCYLNLLCERCSSDPKLPKVYAFNTFFYTNISTRGYDSVKRWTRKVDIFSFDILIVPVHMHNNHWCLAVIDFSSKKIEYYDSLHGNNQKCLQDLKEYLCQESLNKKKTQFDLTGWSFVIRTDCPEQLNGSDCGMFSLKFAEFASRRKELVFNQQHMPYYRKRMVYEIINQKLL